MEGNGVIGEGRRSILREVLLGVEALLHKEISHELLVGQSLQGAARLPGRSKWSAQGGDDVGTLEQTRTRVLERSGIPLSTMAASSGSTLETKCTLLLSFL